MCVTFWAKPILLSFIMFHTHKLTEPRQLYPLLYVYYGSYHKAMETSLVYSRIKRNKCFTATRESYQFYLHGTCPVFNLLELKLFFSFFIVYFHHQMFCISLYI